MDGSLAPQLERLASSPENGRVDALAFISTAVAVVTVNAALAVAIGSSLYVARAAHHKFFGARSGVPDMQVL